MRRAAPLAVLLTALAGLAGCAPNRGEGYLRAFTAGERAQSAGRYEEAASLYEEASKAARLPRDRDYALHAAATMHGRAGDRSTAFRELEDLATGPSEEAAVAADEAAMMLIAHGDETGWSALEAVLLRFPNHGVARSILHRILLHEDEERGDVATLSLLDHLRPSLDPTLRASEVAYETALRLERTGHLKEARDAYVGVADRWPYPHGALFDDALTHASILDERLGQYDQAIADLRKTLAVRESSWLAGSYERPKFDAAKMRIADLYETRMHDDAQAVRELHELYADFKTSLLRDDALWKESRIWDKEGKAGNACDALSSLVHDFPDSRYVPCAVERCSALARPPKSHAPKACPPYIAGRMTGPEAEAPTSAP